jgi:ATP synthase F1 gamma subunit
MATLTALKKELEFNTELVGLIDVMKGIAASQFQALQKRKERFRKFLDSFASFFELIDFSSVAHPFASVGTERMGIVMVTSDEGFMGGLNTHVISAGLAERKNHAPSRKSEADLRDKLIIVGERGAAYLKGLGEEFIAFEGISEENKYELAVKLKDYIMQQSKEGKIGKVVLSYPHPVSFTFQKVEVVTILPCTELFEGQPSAISHQPSAKDFKLKAESRQLRAEKVIIESSMDAIIEHLVAEWITQKLYEVFDNSKLSEFAARTVHLEASYQNLSELRKVLRYQYFRAKHGFIDRGMRETFASQLLRRRK